MRDGLTDLGWARLYMDRNGQVLYRQEGIRRGLAGEDFSGDDHSHDEDSMFEEDDNYGYDDDLGYDDDYGYDEDDDYDEDDEMSGVSMDDDDDFGASIRERLAEGRQRRQNRRQTRRGNRRQNRRNGGRVWAKTILADSATVTAAGSTSITMRPQHDFIADDISFTGSLANSLITAIYFGDRLVFNSANGVPVETFAVGGFMRGLLQGQKLTSGLDIVINATLPGAGTVYAQVVGKKPSVRC